VEENHEYIEREDEFDIQPLEEIHKRRLDQEDEEVDVLTIEPVKTATEIEAGDIGFRMPILLDIEASDSEDEVVAVGAGQYRRRTEREWVNDDEMGETASNGSAAVANGTKRRRNG
jgi:COMPASS component SWD1